MALCGGLIPALAALFCVSGWGGSVQPRGPSVGTKVFYIVWILSGLLALVLPPRKAAGAMSNAAGLGFLGAALGSWSAVGLRGHPVILGVNLAFVGLGLSGVALSYRLLREPGGLE